MFSINLPSRVRCVYVAEDIAACCCPCFASPPPPWLDQVGSHRLQLFPHVHTVPVYLRWVRTRYTRTRRLRFSRCSPTSRDALCRLRSESMQLSPARVTRHLHPSPKLQTPARPCFATASNNSFYSDNLWDVLDSLPKTVQEPFTTNPKSFHFDGFDKTMHSMDMNNTPHYISPLFASVPSSVFEPQIEVRDFDAQTQIPMVCLYFN